MFSYPLFLVTLQQKTMNDKHHIQISYGNKADLDNVDVNEVFIYFPATFDLKYIKRKIREIGQTVSDNGSFYGIGICDAFDEPIILIGGKECEIEGIEGKGLEITNLYIDNRITKELFDNDFLIMYEPYLDYNYNGKYLRSFVCYYGDLEGFPSDVMRIGFEDFGELKLKRMTGYGNFHINT